MLLSIAIYLFLMLSYVQVKVNNDGLVYYDFMRRLVGEDVRGYAYQFGTSFWNLPFYLLGRLISVIGVGNTVSGLEVGNIAVAVATNVAVIVIFYLAWRIIRDLGLRGGPGAILLTTFGTPLFYYAIFQPAYKHAVDTLVVTLLAFLLLRADREPGKTRVAVALGVIMAVAISIRYADAVLIIGPIYVLLRARSFVQTYLLVTIALVGSTAILLIPLVRGIPYGLPSSTNPAPAPALGKAASTPPVPAESGDIVQGVQFDPLVPLKMLFTTKRGLFVWTPLTLFATLGYVVFAIQAKRHRGFLIGLGLSAIALLLVHSLWGGYWTGGFSFSQRFLTGLFPLFAVGIAALLQQTRMLVAPLLVACVAWSIFVALTQYYGYDHVSERDGIHRIVQVYTSGDKSLGRLWRERVVQQLDHRWHSYREWI